MNRCPITYELCENKYSKKGLYLLNRNLKNLHDFPYTPKQQIELSMELATKLSIQGVQPKLSIKLIPKKESFEVVEKGGTFILKPPHQLYDQLPQNEDLTMKLAAIVGLEIPFHGMIYNIDDSLSYFIKRFDRVSGGSKLGTEDFSQLMGYSRDTKYDSSMEKVVETIEKTCSFPVVEKMKLFRVVMFNFLVGNEDMHLKNFSIIRRQNSVELSPFYDLLNSSIVMKAKEEIALPIRGKKSNLKYADLIEYFGCERLALPFGVIEKELLILQNSIEKWRELISQSFLTSEMQDKYQKIISDRWLRIIKK